jgi:Tfp pilus assembly protein FimT
MMDALGVAQSSLLKGEEDEEISRETMEDIDEARRTLAKLTVSQKHEDSMACKDQNIAKSSGSTKIACTDDCFHSQKPWDDVLSQSTSSTLPYQDHQFSQGGNILPFVKAQTSSIDCKA